MARNSDGVRSEGLLTFLLCLFLFLHYNFNLRVIRYDDTVPARLLPFSLLLDGSFCLDKWVEPYLPSARGPSGIYFVNIAQGHWMSSYPILTPLVVSPLYLYPAWWISRQHPPLAKNDPALKAVVDLMEKISASLIATLSAGLLFSALRRIAPPAVSLLLTLVYGLASNTWAISSQGLWRHGLTELSFALLLWALLRDPRAPSSAFCAGLALGMAAANKPVDALIGLAFFVWYARHNPRRLLMFGAPLFVFAFLLLSYGLHFFGGWLWGFPTSPFAGGQDGRVSFFLSPLWSGIAGLLVSPNRGLVVYTPWTVFAFWGAARLWKESNPSWGRYLIVGTVAIFLLHARYRWWGGWCFGPRYLTDFLPFLAFFLVPVWPRIQASSLLRAAFVLTTAVALWIQVVGVYYYPSGGWDGRPVNVEVDPRRVWDWSDTQIMRSWKAGHAPPLLYYESYWLFKGRMEVRRTQAR